MKKSLILLPMAAVLLSLTGCKKDNEKSGPSGETVTFTANIGGGEKTEIDGVKMMWSDGDKITINGDVFESDFPFEGDYTTANFVGNFTTPTPSDYRAYYPASLYQSGKYVLPAIQTYNGSTLSGINPMYAYQSDVNNKSLQFHNICALVKLEVTGTGTVKQIVVTSDNNLCGEFEPKTDDNVHYYAHITGSGKTLTLNCGTGVTLNETIPTIFYVALPQGTLGDLTFKCCGDVDEWEATPITTATLTAGKLYTKKLENVKIIEFSVSATQKVKFAPGNLYYNGADNAKKNADLPSGWNFYEHQWDCYPSGTSSVTESMEINLFTWGYGEEWSTVYNTYAYEAGDKMTDWGSVAIGSDPADTWRTLNRDEWNYLLGYDPEVGQTSAYGRPNAMNLCAWKELDGGTHNGLVILPDGTDASVMSSITTTSDLATSGAVFLPAAGYRVATTVVGVGSGGAYWSSTPSGRYAYHVSFGSGYVSSSYDGRNGGNAVRLVR